MSYSKERLCVLSVKLTNVAREGNGFGGGGGKLFFENFVIYIKFTLSKNRHWMFRIIVTNTYLAIPCINAQIPSARAIIGPERSDYVCGAKQGGHLEVGTLTVQHL
jgi:hypothetical protein